MRKVIEKKLRAKKLRGEKITKADVEVYLAMPTPEEKAEWDAMVEQGRKDDTEKLRWDLLPWGGVEQIVKVLNYGARKYAPENWKKVPDARNRYFAAACRHLFAWFRGEKLDPESGLPHLAHVGCCILFLMHFDKE